MSDKFVYVTYIRTTPEKLWDAIVKPDFVRQWFWGTTFQSDWKKGSPWTLTKPEGHVDTSGKVLEVEKPRRLVISWENVHRPELMAEGASQCTFDIEKLGDSVKLTVTHEIARDNSKLIQAVSGGWPMVLASLKTLLETGQTLPDPRQGATSCAA